MHSQDTQHLIFQISISNCVYMQIQSHMQIASVAKQESSDLHTLPDFKILLAKHISPKSM